MKTLLKIPFKIIAICLIPAFFIVSLIMKFFGWLSGRVLAIVTLLFGIGGTVLLCQGNILVIAFLISPLGVPLFAEAIGKMLDGLNGSLIGFIAT